jgi:hypothetical protein
MNVTQLALDVDDSLAELAAVAFELCLTGAAQTDTTNALAGEVGPETGQTRQPVFELRQLDLETPLVGRRAPGEDIEDKRRAIDDLHVERALEIPLLSGAEIVVDHNHVITDVVAPGLDLFELPFSDVGAGQRMSQLLGHRAHDLDVDSFGQPRQLFERIGGGPGLVLTLDGDQESVFGGAVGGMGRAWNGNLLGRRCRFAQRRTTDCTAP